MRLPPSLPLACLLSGLALGPAAAGADACDSLAARVIRATGASLAGRTDSLAVFRAEDAERLSLTCGPPRRLVIGALDREPDPRFYTLIGLGAQALTGVPARDAETLARVLQQDSLLADAPRQGIVGPAAIRCETGPRADGLAPLRSVCVVVPSRPPRRPLGRSLPPLRAKG